MMYRIYQAKEVKPGVWQKKTKIAFEIDELICLWWDGLLSDY